MKVFILYNMLARWAQGVNSDSPVAIMVEGRLFRSWYRYMKKSEICFTDRVGKSTEFPLHHFSKRAHFDL